MTIAVDLGRKATKTKTKLVSVAGETGFSHAMSETLKAGFVATRPIVSLAIHLSVCYATSSQTAGSNPTKVVE